jgi:uncharacterized cupredoxin-like copper-binding protein
LTPEIILGALGVLLAVAANAAPGREGHAHSATSADGQPGSAAEADRTVRVEARDTAFDVKRIQVRAGETIRFVVTSTGQLVHEFAIAHPEENEAHRKMMQQMPDMVHDEPNVIMLKPGETKELVWKFGKEAALEFSCNIPGHAKQGMKGALRVVR